MIPFTSDNASLSIVATENMRGWSNVHVLRLKERSQEAVIPASSLPRRGGSRPGGFVIPLLVD